MADVVIQVACGERAGDVLETISDLATMRDPRGGLLMERTDGTAAAKKPKTSLIARFVFWRRWPR